MESQQHSNNVRVFISYASEDTRIAETLRTELISFSIEHVSVFHDASDLRTGTEWERVLSHELATADLLIAIHTGRRRSAFSFPGWEIGAFTALRAHDPRGKDVFCLYDTDTYPEIFRQYHNRKVVIPPPDAGDDFFRHSPLWKFLTEFEQRCRSRFGQKSKQEELKMNEFWDTRKLQACKSITQSFTQAQGEDIASDVFPQRRIIIEVSDGDFYLRSDAKLPDSAIVRPEANAFAVLGIPAEYDEHRQLKPYTWKRLREIALQNNRAPFPWMDQVNEVIITTLRTSGFGDQLQISFMAPDDKVYRAILSRHQLFKNNSRTFYIDLVQAFPKKFPGDELTSQLLIGLVFASRFRFLFIEVSPKSYAQRIRNSNLDEMPVLARQLRRDIDRMPLEAAEFGLSDIHHLAAICGEEHQAQVESFFELWTREREKLMAAVTDAIDNADEATRARLLDAIANFRKNLTSSNQEFIRIMLEKYRGALGLKSD